MTQEASFAPLGPLTPRSPRGFLRVSATANRPHPSGNAAKLSRHSLPITQIAATCGSPRTVPQFTHAIYPKPCCLKPIRYERMSDSSSVRFERDYRSSPTLPYAGHAHVQ